MKLRPVQRARCGRFFMGHRADSAIPFHRRTELLRLRHLAFLIGSKPIPIHVDSPTPGYLLRKFALPFALSA